MVEMKYRFKHLGGSYNIVNQKSRRRRMPSIVTPCSSVHLCDGALLLVHAQWVVFNLFASLGFSDERNVHCNTWLENGNCSLGKSARAAWR